MSPVVIVLILLAAAILVLAAVVMVRTASFRSKQLPAAEKISYPIDADAAAGRLSGAIQFRTISGVDMSKVDYSAFRGFHEYLEKSFPLVHSRLEKNVINSWGLLYVWKGSDPALKPVLLMAHHDVVPASDENWKQPPFSGAIDDGYVWGRGTLDDKGSLLATMEALEYLLKEGYNPSRSIYLVSGYDEEVGGREGAARIAEYVKGQGVKFEFVLDEGSAVVKGMVPGLAGWVALIGIAEKGFISLELTTEQKGGHSMAPPPQTSLGILATAISKLQNNLFPLRWTEAVKEQYQCLGAEMPFPMKMMFANMWLFGPLIMKKLTAVAQTAASLRTTTAPTMFSGSPQDNVLPMRASAVVNFRILQGDTTQSVIDRVKRLINDPRVTISTYGNNNSEPSPVASLNSRSYGIINRTTREVLGDVLVIPTLVLGKTDSIKFAGLAECCYRYVPQRMTVAEIGAVHGFNERISIDNYTEMISFFIRLLHNSCE